MESFDLVALNKKLGWWQVKLGPEHVELISETATPLIIPRSEIVGRFELVDLWGGQAVLVVKRDEKPKKVQFKLTGEQREAIDRWIGPRTVDHLQQVLRRRYAFGLVIGLVLIFVSLPFPGDPAAGIEATPASPLTATLGAVLILMWLAARYRPTPRLFLVDSAWFVLLMISLLIDILTGRASVLWFAWFLLVFPFVRSGMREYRRYKHLLDRPARPEHDLRTGPW